jgi:hypothetical protein
MAENKPSDERNGNFLDSMWCCKVCDGEIPDGHTNDCDIWKLEKKHKEFIANEYNAVLLERDELQKANREWALSDAKMRSGWYLNKLRGFYDIARRICESAQATGASANALLVHRQLIGELRAELPSQSDGGTKP